MSRLLANERMPVSIACSVPLREEETTYEAIKPVQEKSIFLNK
jgi:hypothetical protein